MIPTFTLLSEIKRLWRRALESPAVGLPLLLTALPAGISAGLRTGGYFTDTELERWPSTYEGSLKLDVTALGTSGWMLFTLVDSALRIAIYRGLLGDAAGERHTLPSAAKFVWERRRTLGAYIVASFALSMLILGLHAIDLAMWLMLIVLILASALPMFVFPAIGAEGCGLLDAIARSARLVGRIWTTLLAWSLGAMAALLAVALPLGIVLLKSFNPAAWDDGALNPAEAFLTGLVAVGLTALSVVSLLWVAAAYRLGSELPPNVKRMEPPAERYSGPYAPRGTVVRRRV